MRRQRARNTSRLGCARSLWARRISIFLLPVVCVVAAVSLQSCNRKPQSDSAERSEATREGSSDEPDASAEGKAKSSRPTRRITAAWYPVPPQSLAKRRAPDEFTAAHNNLPLGTRVRVTNPDNGRTLTVRITDRGIRDRRVKLDVCKEAAVELGIVREGFADLKMEVLRDEEEPQRAAASQTVASGNDQSRNSE